MRGAGGGDIVIVPALCLARAGLGLDPGLTMKMAVGTSLATIVFTAVSFGLGH